MNNTANKGNLVQARYESIWDDGSICISTSCIVDTFKREVIYIEMDDSDADVTILDKEQVIIPDPSTKSGTRTYPVYVRGDEPISPETRRSDYFVRD